MYGELPSGRVLVGTKDWSPFAGSASHKQPALIIPPALDSNSGVNHAKKEGFIESILIRVAPAAIFQCLMSADKFSAFKGTALKYKLTICSLL